MNLADYLKLTRKTRTQFAQDIGVSRQSVVRYLSGERSPSGPTLTRILEITDGAVTPNDFFRVAA